MPVHSPINDHISIYPSKPGEKWNAPCLKSAFLSYIELCEQLLETRQK